MLDLSSNHLDKFPVPPDNTDVRLTIYIDDNPISALPDNLQFAGYLGIGETQITNLPPGFKDAELYWNNVRINEQIAFHPETLTADDVLNEPNVEVRRVMIERMGLEHFLTITNPTEHDHDTDPGGERRLLEIDMDDDEPVVVLSVHDPSTKRQYFLRVPPDMQTCHQAAAWIAGFDDPNDYRPLMET